jgi:hypothetical protein
MNTASRADVARSSRPVTIRTDHEPLGRTSSRVRHESSLRVDRGLTHLRGLTHFMVRVILT